MAEIIIWKRDIDWICRALSIMDYQIYCLLINCGNYLM